MSETSRSRVTITLGRTGEVVKRDGISYDGAYANALPHAGNKRSVRERLGNSLDSFAQFSNKRCVTFAPYLSVDKVLKSTIDLPFHKFLFFLCISLLTEIVRLLSCFHLLSMLISLLARIHNTKNGRYCCKKFTGQMVIGSLLNGYDSLLSLELLLVYHMICFIVSYFDRIKDIRLSRDDLRHKIIRKNLRNQSHTRLQDGEDLRNILSRPAQSSTNNASAWEKLSETNYTRPRYLEPRDSRHHIPAPKDDIQLMSVSRSSSQHLPLSKAQLLLNPRVQHVSDARESGRSDLEPKDSKYRIPEISRSIMISDVHGPRTANNVSKMDPGTNSSSPWTLDHSRRRTPPDEGLMSSRGLPVPVRDEQNRIYAVRTLGDTRSSALKDALEFSRPTNSSSYLTQMASPVGPMKTMAPIVSRHPLPSSHAQNTSYVVDDHPTVDFFLRSLGLEKFAVLFKAEEVDMYSLKRMTDTDFKVMGIPMGPRKKIMFALQPRLRRQA